MAELGSTTDPKALIPGEPEQVWQTVAGFQRYADALITAGNGLGSITTDGWEGEAGDAFRSWFDGEPQRWLRCGDAFHAAAGALDRYSYTLGWAQRQAAEAIALWEHGEAATEQAKAEHAQAQAQANQQAAAATAAGTPTVAPSIPFSDPGEEMRAQARHLLDNARNQLRSAGDEASATVGEARNQAPPEPSLLGKVGNFLGELAAGIGEGTVGLAEFVWSVSPARAILDPVGFQESMTTLAQRVVHGVQNPAEFGKAIIDYDTWKQSPGRAIGHLVPDLVLGAATGGAGTAAARSLRGAKALDELADVSKKADDLLGAGVKTIEPKPLRVDRKQIERKYNLHARDFGVDQPRGREGFEQFQQAVEEHVNNPRTLHIDGTYRQEPAILNYNPDTNLVVIQKPDGEYWSGWKLGPEQVKNVTERGGL